jgi:AMP-binding enzyme C-terminal domain
MTKQARKTYRCVFGTTILPGGYAAEQVEQRRRVNTRMREQSKQWFDAVFDFATSLCSPDDEAMLHPAYDAGDGMHPNDEGYRLMAEAMDISLLTGSLDDDVTAAALQAYCRSRLADFKVPKVTHFVKELPKDSTGKVQRLRLTDLVSK